LNINVSHGSALT